MIFIAFGIFGRDTDIVAFILDNFDSVIVARIKNIIILMLIGAVSSILHRLALQIEGRTGGNAGVQRPSAGAQIVAVIVEIEIGTGYPQQRGRMIQFIILCTGRVALSRQRVVKAEERYTYGTDDRVAGEVAVIGQSGKRMLFPNSGIGCGIRTDFQNTGIITGIVPPLADYRIARTGISNRTYLSTFSPCCTIIGFIEINTADANQRGIIDGEIVRAFSRRGEIAIPARVTEDIRPGIVNIPMHFAECAANVLTNSDSFDPKSKMVELKACAIQVEKFSNKVQIKDRIYKDGTDTDIKAEDIKTTTVGGGFQ